MEAFKETMAKRARGSTSRPGQRPPLQRQATRPATRPVAATAPVARREDLTDAEEARAGELEAAILAEERQAEAAQKRTRTARTVETAPRVTSSLAVTAADEYAYVARDIRRIAIVGGAMVVILLAIWAVVHITGIAVL
ncbi:MAG: hypothetical protein ABJC39_02920 [Chloroflexota bacterium]